MPTLVPIAGGWFLMGSEDGADDERPVHHVWVDAFEIAATQVTNREYSAFRAMQFDEPDQPVVGVSWFDAVEYCRRLGPRYRLPTEAEWEYAARGGMEGMRYPWGDAPQLRPEYDRPMPVARGVPNAFGLYDMCENVHEWCSDWYDSNYYAQSPERNPRGPESGSRRSSRGGSWRHQIKISRCAARSSIPPEFRYADYGFRVGADPKPIESTRD
jgi:formylglycine-generating enzyme required for sulfatase activity